MTTAWNPHSGWQAIVAKAGPALVNSPLGMAVRRLAPEVMYPRPHSTLGIERLYFFLDALWRRRELPGAVVEVGCYLGGTSALGFQLLQETGFPKRYVCVDTFRGFVPEQFGHDARQHGTSARERRGFSRNSRAIVARLLRYYGCGDIELVEGDVARLSESVFPQEVAVALIDVDLEIPVYEALRRLYPRIVDGGVAIIDDCRLDSPFPGARAGYRRFVAEKKLTERYEFGMGVLSGSVDELAD